MADFWFDRLQSLDELESLKQNIVVHDGDSKLDVECLKRHALRPINGTEIPFQLVPLKGMTWEQWHSTAIKAKAMIDLLLPGYEFGNLEAALMGAVHIPSAHSVARNHRDYPIPESHKIFLHQNQCEQIGKRIGEVLADWKTEAQKQKRFRALPSKFRNQQWMDMLHFFEDDVTIVVPGYSPKSYEQARGVTFAGFFLYPHATFQINQQINGESYHDFNSAMDFFTNMVQVAPFDLKAWHAEPHISGDVTSLLTPLENQRLYVAFLPPGYLPLSKATFGYLATELERRKHRHWVLCPETGLVFARGWWYQQVQPKLLEQVMKGPSSLWEGLNFAQFAYELYKHTCGAAEVQGALLDQGKVHSLGVFLDTTEFESLY